MEGAAHRSALAAGGDRIAVLAGGVDRPYPAGHRELLDRVADVGLMVSEMAPGTTQTRRRFLARGRLMAALSEASVVVEAGVRSGSLRVAAEACVLGRGVGAVPGPVTSVTSAGTHMLLRDGTARVVTKCHGRRAPDPSPIGAWSRTFGAGSGIFPPAEAEPDRAYAIYVGHHPRSLGPCTRVGAWPSLRGSPPTSPARGWSVVPVAAPEPGSVEC
ncbi:DNA-processing protein DprA [Arthrobacter sp. TB 23]|uniref:DNA-processing protein DprA n=1 Tax=Arthrobacter sp. TB 23 TaxID=494419 RepID=UPI000A079806|nr:DNA-processing protein DprA [Arthrobacter sp. TB 23]